MNTEKSSEVVKRARKDVAEKVRNDWDRVLFRTLSRGAADHRYSLGEIASNDTGKYERLEDHEAYFATEDQTEWRERTYASSDPSSDEAVSDCPRLSVDRKSLSKSANGPLKWRKKIFAGHHAMDPDGMEEDSTEDLNAQDAAAAEEKRKEDRRERRRKRLEEEMSWNEGLRYWEQRRDIWCCASRATDSTNNDHSAVNGDSSRSSTSTTAGISAKQTINDPQSHLPHRNTSSITQTPTVIPVAPPLLPPDDPTRASITPSIYPSIYTKVVSRGLTPSIPVNLSHMVPALVEGWKEAGEWPPKPSTPVEANGTGITGGVGAAGSRNSRRVSIIDGIGKDKELEALRSPKKGRRFLGGQSGSSGEQQNQKSKWRDSASLEEGDGDPGTGARPGILDGRESPLRVRKNVARVGRKLRGSLSGSSAAGTGDERGWGLQ